MIKTASLEPCQRLVELGVVLETHFKWYLYPDEEEFAYHTYSAVEAERLQKYIKELCPAPTADELMPIMKKYLSLVVMKNLLNSYYCSDRSFADCLIERLIWLLEQGLISKEEVMKGAER